MKKDNVPGFPGYFVSKRGKVYSRYSRYSQGNHSLGNHYRLLKPKKRPVYFGVTLHNKNGSQKFYVHRLVAMIWVNNPNPQKYQVVLHLDNDRWNNHYKNLKWGTQKENLKQAKDEGRMFNHSSQDNRNPCRRISVEAEEKLRKDYQDYMKDKPNPKRHIKKFIKEQSLKYMVGERTIRIVLKSRTDGEIYNVYPYIIKDYKLGLLRKEICSKWDISQATLTNILRRSNIKLRRR